MRILVHESSIVAISLLYLVLDAVGGSSSHDCSCCVSSSSVADRVFQTRDVVTTQAMGARCAVAADFDGDGDMDLVSASAVDNTVAWFQNDGSGHFGGPQQVTYSSNGARIVTVGDIDADGKIDIIVASYYDHTVGWFKNDGAGNFGNIHITILP
ncbi:unnamed protein product [Prorocentrum cordatum]|uniref:VCBS repeat-containing protein n=1 Tax=Prorocentrum cordatum TaxID=2364126 RepID=A0ABN9Q3N8_9DINO|nr:unnamed protein product [Polarella glacialis]